MVHISALANLIRHTSHILGSSIILVDTLGHHIWLVVISSHHMVILVVEWAALTSLLGVIPVIESPIHSILVSMSTVLHSHLSIVMILEHLMLTHLVPRIVTSSWKVPLEPLLLAISTLVLYPIT